LSHCLPGGLAVEPLQQTLQQNRALHRSTSDSHRHAPDVELYSSTALQSALHLYSSTALYTLHPLHPPSGILAPGRNLRYKPLSQLSRFSRWIYILWPRWVARIGVTRATEACFLAADRQCTELPLLRLPRLVPEVVGCDPFVPRDLARVGWRGLAPFLPIGPRERPRLADSFFAPGSGARGIPRVARPAIRRVAAMRGKERGP
jgi:hypothetical protein